MITWVTRDSITFARSGRIAVSFLTQEIGNEGPSAEAPPELHLILLDAASGKIVRDQTWAAPWATFKNVYVGSTDQGNFVMLQDKALRVYSPSLHELDRIN